MPKLNGLQLLWKIEKQNLSHGRVLIVTGQIGNEFSAEQLRLITKKSYTILPKPFSKDDLYRCLTSESRGP